MIGLLGLRELCTKLIIGLGALGLCGSLHAGKRKRQNTHDALQLSRRDVRKRLLRRGTASLEDVRKRLLRRGAASPKGVRKRLLRRRAASLEDVRKRPLRRRAASPKDVRKRLLMRRRAASLEDVHTPSRHEDDEIEYAVRETWRHDQTELHIAVMRDAFCFVNSIISKYSTNQQKLRELLDRADCEGQTALHKAAMRGQKLIVNSLLLGGADIYLQDRRGRTAFLYAIECGHEHLINAFMQAAKAAPQELVDLTNLPDIFETTPLHAAIATDKIKDERLRLELVASLIGMGADARARDSLGRTILHLAAGHGHLDIVKYLVELAQALGQETELLVNDSYILGRRPLHVAAAYGQTKVARYLLDVGANEELLDSFGLTAWEVAEEEGHADFKAAVARLAI